MPMYEYQCEKCQKVSEVIQKFSDAPLDKCPECGGKVTKLLSRTSFQLKGTGWYASDYKKGQSSPAPSKPPSTESASAAPATAEAPKASSHSCGGGCKH
jgi:putative FmdB family regulatory protein